MSVPLRHDSRGNACVPGPSHSPDGSCYRAATHARDSSVNSAHLDTATATQLLITLAAPCALADLVSFLPPPCYCVVYSSVNDKLSFVALACASFGVWWERAIGVGEALRV